MKKIQIGPPEGKIPVRIRIFQCSQIYYWYKDLNIYKNKQYEVLAYEEGKGYTVKRFKYRQQFFIDIADADVVEYVDDPNYVGIQRSVTFLARISYYRIKRRK